jgi:hypothetical protein
MPFGTYDNLAVSDSRGIGPTRETTLRHMFLHDRDEVGVVKDYAALMRIWYLGEAGGQVVATHPIILQTGG